MFNRRRLLAALAVAALLAPGLALAQANEKKKGGGITYVQFATLTATIIKTNGRRGVLTVEAGVDVPNCGLRGQVNLNLPRLRAAYIEVLQGYVYSLSPGDPPNPDYLEVMLQKATDRVLGRPGASFCSGPCWSTRPQAAAAAASMILASLMSSAVTPPDVVGRQHHLDPVVDVEPLGMMVELLGRQGHAGHPSRRRR